MASTENAAASAPPADAKLDLSGLGSVKLQHQAPPSGEFSKAVALTQTAINNLGGPIHASMTDHQPKDLALAQALTQNAIEHQGEKHVDSEKLPLDRAIAEALTLNAIAHQPQDKLKQTGRRSSLTSTADAGLTPEQKAALLEEAKAEKDRKAAAKVFGGGDAKEGMANILGEINNQGIIAVPSNKVPDQNITLTQMKTLAQINNLGERRSSLKHTAPPADQAIIQARTLAALNSETPKANLKHEEHKDKGDKALAEALTLKALDSDAAKAHLKPVERPQEGMTAENLAALQAAAQLEKAEPASGTKAEPAATKAE